MADTTLLEAIFPPDLQGCEIEAIDDTGETCLYDKLDDLIADEEYVRKVNLTLLKDDEPELVRGYAVPITGRDDYVSQLAASYVAHDGDERYAVWVFAPSVPYNAVLDQLRELDELFGLVDDPCDFIPVNGKIDTGTKAYHDFDDFVSDARIFWNGQDAAQSDDSAAAHAEAPEGGQPIEGTDAILYGDVEALQPIMQKKIQFGMGKYLEDRNWKSSEASIGDFLMANLLTHKEGDKDGVSFAQGWIVGGKRLAKSMRENHIIGIDMDTGEPMESMKAKIQKEGWFAVIYTTHSHGKDYSTPKSDEVRKYWKKVGDPIDGAIETEHVVDYLLNERRYWPAVLEDAELEEEVHEEGGIVCKLRHAPMDKYRVVFFLNKPFVFAQRDGSQQDAIQEWKERYNGLGQRLEAAFDRKTVDPSRLFFNPRHPAGAENYAVWVIGGKLLDINRIPREDLHAVAQSQPENAFVAEGQRASHGAKTDSGYEFQNPWVKKFGIKFAQAFNAADWAADYAGDDMVDTDLVNGKCSVPCPNSDSHSADIERSTGFVAQNAGYDGDPGFRLYCSHDGCHHLKDRLISMDMLVTQWGCTEEDLLEYVDNIEGLELVEEDEKPETHGFVFPEDGIEDIEKEMEEALDGIITLSLKEFAGLSEALGLAQIDEIQINYVAELLKERFGMAVGPTRSALRSKVKANRPDKETRRSNKIYSDKGVIETLKLYNDRWGVVATKKGARVIVKEHPLNPNDKRIVVNRREFDDMFANETIWVSDGEGMKEHKATKLWWEWPPSLKSGQNRSTYSQIIFDPSEELDPRAFNTWEGFAYEGHDTGSYDLLEEHLFENICHSNEEWYHFLMTWLAHIVQFPEKVPGSAIVMKGLKGVGKSILFNKVMKEILGKELAVTISSSDEIFGGFNSHLSERILCVMEEAFWAGNSKDEGRLKTLITEEDKSSTAKFGDTDFIRNYCRLAILSNEDWVVPVSLQDERRFFVLEVSEARRGDTDFFAAMLDELDNGGYETFMYDLMNWVPDDDNWHILRKPPETPWLQEQALIGLPPHESWVLDLIKYGKLDEDERRDLPEIELNEDRDTYIPSHMLYRWYESRCALTATGRNRGSKTAFGRMMKKLLPGVETKAVRYAGDEKHWSYVFPPAADLRDRFKSVLGNMDEVDPSDLVQLGFDGTVISE